MRKQGSFVVVFFVLGLASSAFAQVEPGQVKSRKANQCLSDEELKINKDLKALNRPTIKTDPNWIFDPDYLIGKWTFDWDVPETPISSGGKATGSYTFKRIEDCYYEGAIQANGPDGPYTGKVLVMYSPEVKYMTWLETDSRGLSVLRFGRVAGDLGGYFTHHWEVPAFTYKGKVVRLSGTTFFSSPTSFRYRPRISLDGGEFVNYGNPWFTREGPPPSTKPAR
jgi:hypothetical protein